MSICSLQEAHSEHSLTEYTMLPIKRKSNSHKDEINAKKYWENT